MKKYIIEKSRQLFAFVVYIFLPLVGGGWMGVSCNDFLTIYPTDRIVGEDFWKTKSDVDQMVDGCYLSMLNEDVQARAIIWGAYRSDELVKRDDLTDQTLDNINAVNLLPTMGYCSWASLYKVINNCNVVLNHAPEVMTVDPEFTEGDYQVVRAQMLALRSLCYFYLVRAFRDVPYMSHSVENDNEVEAVPQVAPGEVLQHCLDDLQEARRYIMKSGGYGQNDWRNWGYITSDAVDAIMADIYLWRGSMTHDNADYQKVVELVDRVVEAKDAYYQKYNSELVGTGKKDIYHLYDAEDAQLMLFHYNNGNCRESILEWQYNGINNANSELEKCYYKTDNSAQHGRLMASKIFNSIETNANKAQAQKLFFTKNDYRFWNIVYDADNAEAEQLAIRKMVYAESSESFLTPKATAGLSKSSSRDFSNFRQNWIVYRITDLMLMKAEALVAMCDNENSEDSQAYIKQAFNLVQAVNLRSMDKTAKDTLRATNFRTKDAMEILVLTERERELCFEGKRWWDLMRFCYRGMKDVDINHTMAGDLASEGTDTQGSEASPATKSSGTSSATQGSEASANNNWPKLRKEMADFIVRKYKAGEGDAVSYKMNSEPYLYWPVYENEMKANVLLKQNPVWIQEKSTEKN